MISINRYKSDDYNKDVQDYMTTLLKCLKKDYGELRDEWQLSLDLIAQTYETYLMAYHSVKADGVYTKDTKNRVQRNPALTVMNNSQAYLQKLITQFALTPMSKSKMKKGGDESSESAEEYIADLCGD